jgi:hypothetical protein
MSIDRSRAGKRARRRGNRGENEVRDLIRHAGWTGAHRNFMSGGAGGGDLADAIPDVHLEVKFVERLDLPGAWRQACAGARPTDTPVVASRANFQPWIGSLRLTDLMGLPVLAWAPMVIGPRAGVRAEFLALKRTSEHPLLVHQVNADALATVLFTDLLVLLGGQREAAA